MDSGSRHSSGTQTPESSSDRATPTLPKTPPDTGGDAVVEAERIKERGNAAFKAQRYDEAIDFYTKAIGADYLVFTLQCCRVMFHHPQISGTSQLISPIAPLPS
jgi:hypothetical protein